MANLDGRRFQWVNLTQKRVEAFAPTKDDETLWDGRIVGFGVRGRLAPSPTRPPAKSYVYLYRNKSGRTKRITIGSIRDLTLDEARAKAQRLQSEVKVYGEDPAGQKTKQRGQTVEIAYNDYMAYKMSQRSENYRDWTFQRFRTELLPELGKLPVASVTRSSIRALTDRAIARDSPTEANHIHKVASAFLSWCADRELITANPIFGCDLPAPLAVRDRVLEPAELMHIWLNSDRLGPTFAAMLRLLMLTAQRKDEVRCAKVEEFDIAAKTWVVPGARTKNRSANTVHLAPLALEVLRSAPRKPDQVFVFQSPKGPRARNPFCPEPAPLTGLNQRVRACKELMEIKDWCIHDLRRTAATQMAALKVQPHVIEVVLNHRSGFRGGVAGIYNRHRYLDESREAWEKWSAQVECWIRNPPKTRVAPVIPSEEDYVVL